MKIHEFQAKQLFRDAQVPVLENIVVTRPAEAAEAYTKLGGSLAVVKAQI
ncbi:MAG: succinate--CoA ligase subunit beta, partial [Planctomycetaceae bacterium]|nr:succinate--CoA ligase subunit beta [Planctomycetaceae bacterium]